MRFASSGRARQARTGSAPAARVAFCRAPMVGSDRRRPDGSVDRAGRRWATMRAMTAAGRRALFAAQVSTSPALQVRP